MSLEGTLHFLILEGLKKYPVNLYRVNWVVVSLTHALGMSNFLLPILLDVFMKMFYESFLLYSLIFSLKVVKSSPFNKPSELITYNLLATFLFLFPFTAKLFKG